MNDDVIACRLDERAFAERGAMLADELFSGVAAVEELADGYAYRFPGDGDWFERVTGFVAAERRCCPFLRFELEVEPHGGPLWLRLRGPEAVKAFVRDQFGPLVGSLAPS